MGLFFEVIIVGVWAWWLGRRYVLPWLRRHVLLPPGASGAHDAGVWVNEPTWSRIVAELEGDLEPGDRGKNPRRGRPE